MLLYLSENLHTRTQKKINRSSQQNIKHFLCAAACHDCFGAKSLAFTTKKKTQLLRNEHFTPQREISVEIVRNLSTICMCCNR